MWNCDLIQLFILIYINYDRWGREEEITEKEAKWQLQCKKDGSTALHNIDSEKKWNSVLQKYYEASNWDTLISKAKSLSEY